MGYANAVPPRPKITVLHVSLHPAAGAHRSAGGAVVDRVAEPVRPLRRPRVDEKGR
jgi:hypothetical protein